MASNLKTTKYNDGTDIPLVTDAAVWAYLKTPGYCWYNNDAATNKNTYGALYNWYAVNTEKLCPTGWHIPSDLEWTTLTTFLGGTDVAGGKLKETGTIHWQSPNTGATNESLFTALPGGRRDFKTYSNAGNDGNWWSSTEFLSINNFARIRSMSYSGSEVRLVLNDKENGYSVRCIQD
jgi:uncharacterized protein (TIGR02145 family)